LAELRTTAERAVRTPARSRSAASDGEPVMKVTFDMSTDVPEYMIFAVASAGLEATHGMERERIRSPKSARHCGSSPTNPLE
jgi:hypothetical protein